MDFETAIVRLAVMKARLPSKNAALVAAHEGIEAAGRLLAASGFAEPAEGEPQPQTDWLDTLDQGAARLRRRFAALANAALPRSARALLLPWELDETKTALRWLACASRERRARFAFTSYTLDDDALAAVLSAERSVEGFIAALRAAGSPLAPALDAPLWRNNPVEAEYALERHYFEMTLPSMRRRLRPYAEYFSAMADVRDISLAMAVSGGDIAGPEAWYIGAGGLARRDFLRLARAPREAFVSTLAAVLRLPPGEALPSRERAPLWLQARLARRWRLRAIAQPLSLWDFIAFAGEMEVARANLAVAVMAAVSGGPAPVDAYLFSTALS